MAFEEKYFPDGDIVFRVPSWRKKLESMEADIGQSVYAETAETPIFKENEVGIKHPVNGSFIRINDNGAIEAFTAYGTGVRIQPDNLLQLFSDRVQVIGSVLDIRTTPNGTNLNAGVLGEGTYAAFPYKKGLENNFLNTLKEKGYETEGLEGTK